MSFSKNKFKRISSGVVFSGVSLCSSLYSIGNVCSAGQAAVAKNNLLSGLGARSLNEETAKKVVSDVSTNKILMCFGAAVIVFVAIAAFWWCIRNSSVGTADAKGDRSSFDVTDDNVENYKSKNSDTVNIKSKIKDAIEENFDKDFMDLAVKTFTENKCPGYEENEDFYELLKFVEKSYIELGLEMEDLSIETEVLHKIFSEYGLSCLNKKPFSSEKNLRAAISLEGSYLRFEIKNKNYSVNNGAETSLYANANIENYIDFLNCFFEKSSKKNGWGDKLEITYNKHANKDERIKIARVKRNSREVVKESFLNKVKCGNLLDDETFAIANQNRNGPFEKVFFFYKRGFPASNSCSKDFLSLLRDFKEKIFEISKEELTRIIDRDNLLALERLLNEYSDKSKVKIRIVEVQATGRLKFKIVEDCKESAEFLTIHSTSNMEKVKELANYLKTHQINEEENEQDNKIDDDMSEE